MNDGGGKTRAGIARCLVRIHEGGTWRQARVPVIREELLEIYLNGQRLATIACGGRHAEELAVGWLRAEGYLLTSRDLKGLETGKGGRAVFVRAGAATVVKPAKGETVIAASGARTSGVRKRNPDLKPPVTGPELTSPERIFHLMEELAAAATLHRQSRGTHGAALADAAGLLAVREDIGRHNCLDMLSGYCLLNGLDGGDKLLLRTGRVSMEIVHKIWRMGVPVVASLSVPTVRAVRIARQAGITLIGAVRRPALTVYTHPERIGET